MINEIHRKNIQEILLELDEVHLFSLCATVTQGLLKNKVQSSSEAIEAICNYSPDELSILKRKIVTKEILFIYLHKHNIQIDTRFTKNDVIDKIATYWNLVGDPPPTTEIKSEHNETEDSSKISELAETFCEWFYTILNRNESIGQEHFFPDAKLRLNMVSSSGDVITEDVENDVERIVQQLYSVKIVHSLYFNPNLTKQGVQGRIDPHGLVMVSCCGTLHSNCVCVGVFNQVFALARDPFSENNWKIKKTQLNLQNKSDVWEPPRLCDIETTSGALSLENR